VRGDWAFSAYLESKNQVSTRIPRPFTRALPVEMGNAYFPTTSTMAARSLQKVSQVKKTKRGLYV
jgi:hypothetical protein